MAVAKTELPSLNNSSLHQISVVQKIAAPFLSTYHPQPEQIFPIPIVNPSLNPFGNYFINISNSSLPANGNEVHSKMNSCTTNNSSYIIPNLYTSAKTLTKFFGNFESSIANSRVGDTSNNNSNIGMTSNIPPNSTDEPRVPVNGESTPGPTACADVGFSKAGPMPIDSYYHGGRKSSSQSRKNSIFSSNTHPRFKDYIYGNEHWKDDSLSSSFSSSMSSLPSIPTPPSPASPPCLRPQSLPQSIEESSSNNPRASSDLEVLSASMPDSDFLTTYSYPNSCGSSPRKRVKDQEGFIRRAACICVNESETEVRTFNYSFLDKICNRWYLMLRRE